MSRFHPIPACRSLVAQTLTRSHAHKSTLLTHSKARKKTKRHINTCERSSCTCAPASSKTLAEPALPTPCGSLWADPASECALRVKQQCSHRPPPCNPLHPYPQRLLAYRARRITTRRGDHLARAGEATPFFV